MSSKTLTTSIGMNISDKCDLSSWYLLCNTSILKYINTLLDLDPTMSEEAEKDSNN